MFCKKCGKPIEGNAKFCNGCGTIVKIHKQPPNTIDVDIKQTNHIPKEVPFSKLEAKLNKINNKKTIFIVVIAVIFLLCGLTLLSSSESRAYRSSISTTKNLYGNSMTSDRAQTHFAKIYAERINNNRIIGITLIVIGSLGVILLPKYIGKNHGT